MWLLLSIFLAMGETSEEAPEYLYKILTPAAWEASQKSDRLKLGPDDTDFIHLAEAHQVVRIAKKFFSEHKQVAVIELRPSELPGRLVKEANPGGSTRYFHLYDGHIPITAVASYRLLNNEP